MTVLSIVTFGLSLATLIFSVGVNYAAVTWRFRLVNYRLRQQERELDDMRKVLSAIQQRTVSSRYTAEDRLEP